MGIADWRNLAIIWLVLPLVLWVLVVGVALYFLNRGMAALRRWLRAQFPRVHDLFWKIAEVSDQVSQKVAAPIIGVEAAAEKTSRWADALRTLTRNGK